DLRAMGWGDELRIDGRFAAGEDAGALRAHAVDLMALKPDVVACNGSPALTALLRETQSVPIVFANVADPVSSGCVSSLSHPGGNVTGFTYFEPLMAGKWLELLREVMPTIARAGALYNPETSSMGGWTFLNALQAAAPASRIDIQELPVADQAAIAPAL